MAENCFALRALSHSSRVLSLSSPRKDVVWLHGKNVEKHFGQSTQIQGVDFDVHYVCIAKRAFTHIIKI
jgi:hypothetical protein